MNKRSIRVLEYKEIKTKLKDLCSSNLGKDLVDKLLPLSNIEDIKMGLKETSEAQSVLLKKGAIPFSSFYDMKLYLKKASIGSTLDGKNLLKIADSMRTGRIVKNYLKDFDDSEILKEKVEQITTIKELEDKIYNAIISEDEISDNASTELKRIRRTITGTQEQIRTKINNIITSASYSKYLQESIVTTRQDRFVVPVKVEYRSNFPGIVHDSSASGATLFIEPMAIVDMNNILRELRGKEREEIERILKELTDLVGGYSEELIINQGVLTELDFIMAKGKLSVEMRAIEPNINSEDFLDLKKARHPLIDKNKVISSDIRIGKNFQTLVITGPNTGGKTVTLKTVGLLSLMLQSGLHVTCDYGSSMCIFENIYADIGDEQSIEQSLSTFSSHMTHIVKILDELGGKNLVLFDELGAGTDPLEGAALAIAILENVKNRGALCIATTHYSELKNYALTKDGVENASVEFDVQTLSPTYKLLIGVPGKSNAFEISRKLGLSQGVIDRSKALLKHENIVMEDILNELELQKKLAQKDREAAQVIYERAKKLEEKLNEKEEKFKIQKEKVLNNAKKEAQKILKDSKIKSDELIKELRDLKNLEDKSKMNKEIEKVRSQIKDSLGGLNYTEEIVDMEVAIGKSIKNAKIGQEVYVPSFAKAGLIISIDDIKEEAQVQIGIMKINLPFKALQKAKSNKSQPVKKTGAGKILKEKAQNIKTEVDLRGMDLETALIEVEKYVDNAYLSGLERVTIIHGVGTGVLKKGIKEWLRPFKHLKFRDGTYGEGGIGVTIVEFK